LTLRVFFNKDYEQYAIKRDNAICELCKSRISFLFFFKDQVVLKKRNYKSRWIAVPYIHHLKINGWINIYGTTTLEYTGSSTSSNFHKSNYVFPSLGEIGFEESNVKCFLII
jgi:deoxyribodipyrimidine photo-lyase